MIFEIETWKTKSNLRTHYLITMSTDTEVPRSFHECTEQILKKSLLYFNLSKQICGFFRGATCQSNKLRDSNE